MRSSDVIYCASSKTSVETREKTTPPTQDANLNLIQNFLELFPATVIGFRDVENDGFALNLPFGIRRCVRSGEVVAQWSEHEGWGLTNLIGNGFQGGFVPGNHQNIESLLRQLN